MGLKIKTSQELTSQNSKKIIKYTIWHKYSFPLILLH